MPFCKLRFTLPFRMKQLSLRNGGQLSYYLSTNPEPPYAQTSTINPNLVKYYVSKSGLQLLESSIKISSDLSKVRFVLWTPENGAENSWKFKKRIGRVNSGYLSEGPSFN